MKKVKGILQGQVIKLLEKVEAKDGTKVAVIFEEDHQQAKERQLRLIRSGFDMGRIISQSREELHER
ncbi:hypothetical protein KAT45_02170 [Candidatus Aerophobetes bacterium]|nr:hypothetical protein [Candidatus Aerophobetes bacterium]